MLSVLHKVVSAGLFLQRQSVFLGEHALHSIQHTHSNLATTQRSSVDACMQPPYVHCYRTVHGLLIVSQLINLLSANIGSSVKLHGQRYAPSLVNTPSCSSAVLPVARGTDSDDAAAVSFGCQGGCLSADPSRSAFASAVKRLAEARASPEGHWPSLADEEEEIELYPGVQDIISRALDSNHDRFNDPSGLQARHSRRSMVADDNDLGTDKSTGRGPLR